jgi:hypothetical protein
MSAELDSNFRTPDKNVSALIGIDGRFNLEDEAVMYVSVSASHWHAASVHAVRRTLARVSRMGHAICLLAGLVIA